MVTGLRDERVMVREEAMEIVITEGEARAESAVKKEIMEIVQ